MKINTDDKVRQSMLPPTVRPQADPGVSSFADVLDQTAKASDSQKAGPAHAPQPTFRPGQPHQHTADAAYRSTTRALDAMEQYQRLLGDRQATLRAVEPAVHRMRTELADLEPLARSMAADHPLKQIADQAQALISREIARFDGGHYTQND